MSIYLAETRDFAIHGYTAAELIANRVDSNAPSMGLTNWSGKVVTAKDAKVAKNYLMEIELKRLELLVEQFLSYAELQALEQRVMYMKQWLAQLDDFMRFNRRAVLEHKGKVSRLDMEAKVREALQEYRAGMRISGVEDEVIPLESDDLE